MTEAMDNPDLSMDGTQPLTMRSVFEAAKSAKRQNMTERTLQFSYGDSDKFLSELSELYSHSEQDELLDNHASFKSWWLGYLKTSRDKPALDLHWCDAPIPLQKNAVLSLLEEIELSDEERRENAVKSLMYLLQGAFAEKVRKQDSGSGPTAEDALTGQIIHNVYLLYETGVYHVFCCMLTQELDWVDQPGDMESSMESQGRLGKSDPPPSATCLQDNVVLRRLLAGIYIFVETMRREFPSGFDCQHVQELAGIPTETIQRLRGEFMSDIGVPIIGEHTLTLTMFNMIMRFCAGAAPHYPARKIVLLLWKSALAWLGGWKELREEKAELRKRAGLAPFDQDTVEAAKAMSHATLPTLGCPMPGRDVSASQDRCFVDVDGTAKEEGEGSALNSTKNSRRIMLELRKNRPLHNSEDDPDPAPEEGLETDIVMTPIDDGDDSDDDTTDSDVQTKKQQQSLIWIPKVREQELASFLEKSRSKFFGFVLPHDTETTAGFPAALEQSISAVRKYMYVSLSELQTKQEERYSKYIFSQVEENIPQTPAEVLYSLLLPQIPQYMIALLKILLAGAPTAKTKNDSINILVDLLPAPPGDANEHGSSKANSVTEELTIQSVDIHRHKEVIVKAVSATLLLLLKHFKANHVYQFECLCQHLVFANCIPLILKFFDQNVLEHMQSQYEIEEMVYPTNVLIWTETGKWFSYMDEEPTANVQRKMEDGPPMLNYFLWRNLFAAVNLLRILNKFTKWKTSRTMMLVVFKSASILRRAVNVCNILLQLYALKLLKMQAKYLGRQWRKTNMDLMSAIYVKVRHRLNDDWAYGNETNAKPWEFNIEECNLRNRVEKFNMRRYGTHWSGFSTGMSGEDSQQGHTPPSNPFTDPEFRPYDKNLLSVLAEEVVLSERFKGNYESWLDREVFKADIDWDLLMTDKTA